MMNVKKAPITTLCLVLAAVFYSLEVPGLTERDGLAALAFASSPSSAFFLPALTAGLPVLLALGCLALAGYFYVAYERFNATQRLCEPEDVATLPLWADMRASRVSDGEGRTLRLMTVNMLLRPPFINYNGEDFKNERLDLLVRHVLPHYDIVALQEVFWFWNFRLSKLLKAAQAQGFHWYSNNAAPPLSSRKFIDGGLLILSRYPITETNRRIYTNGVQIDGYAAKQALHAKVHITPTTYVHVITTHTQADYATNATNSKNANARMSQIREIGELISDVWKKDPRKAEVVVMGDLNVDGRAHDDNNRMAKRDEWGVWGEEDKDSAEYSLMMSTFMDAVRDGKTTTAATTIKPSTSGSHVRSRSKDAKDASEGKAKESKGDEPSIICTDLVREANKGINPVTIGDVIVLPDGTLKPRETALTDPVTDGLSRSCLDYMLHFEHSKQVGEERLTAVAAQVEPFFFEACKLDGECPPTVTQLSDHYGLSTTFELDSAVARRGVRQGLVRLA